MRLNCSNTFAYLTCLALLAVTSVQAGEPGDDDDGENDGDGKREGGKRPERRPGKEARSRGAPPDFANEKYGDHEAQAFDLWLAKSDKPTPLVVFIHGGGFRAGSKNAYDGGLAALCLQNGISFASIEYRLTGIGHYPMQHHDCARAIQHLRHHAAKWNLDPKRIACTGGSAGAGLSEWLGFHDDLADPKSDDPIARQSTRIVCALPTNAQCTYDPREIVKIVPGKAYDHPAMKALFNVPPTFDWTKDPIPPEVDERMKDCGPLSLLTKDDCPVYIVNNKAACTDGNIHHGNFGKKLEEEMQKLGIECVRRMDSDFPVNGLSMSQEMLQFIQKHFANVK
ncbi:MAG: alpha/beta hydrolase [Planctomycetota bacterium]|nr:alpha/beta hydrolase [Planctomycetota bacterium]